VIDDCLPHLVDATLRANGLLAVTADHGNAEEELDAHDQPITAHTTNLVPFVLVADGLKGSFASGGKLGDVAPTLLTLMRLPIPKEMTGANIFTPAGL
jgi:2,3-bisphosphoglycerate-independent phosphoglycerate mutase